MRKHSKTVIKTSLLFKNYDEGFCNNNRNMIYFYIPDPQNGFELKKGMYSTPNFTAIYW